MKKKLVYLIAFILVFTTMSSTFSTASASSFVESEEVNEFLDVIYEEDELYTSLNEELKVLDDSEINVENLEVSKESITIDVTSEIDESEISLDIQTQENIIELEGSIYEDSEIVIKAYDIYVTDVDGEDFSADFVDKETGETFTYSTSEVTSSVVPYVVYFVGSQVIKAAVKQITKSVIIKKIGTALKSNPLAKIKYTDKVVGQMKQGDYHAFPRSVEAYGKYGKVTTIKGGDGKKRKKVEISGSYKKKDGVFEFIIEPDGVTVNHRLFKPNK